MKLNNIDKKWWLFAAAIMAQFIIIFFWVVSSNNTIQNGTVYKFRLQGYDPHDPFRGEYLRIRLKDNKVELPVDDTLNFSPNEDVYVIFEEDYLGCAKPTYLSKYVSGIALKVKLAHLHTVEDCINGSRLEATISYPFDRIWMNQEDCPVAESIINRALTNNQDVYALISIKDGNGVILDVEVEGKTIKELIEMRYSTEQYEEDVDVVVDAEAESDYVEARVEDDENSMSTEEIEK